MQRERCADAITATSAICHIVSEKSMRAEALTFAPQRVLCIYAEDHRECTKRVVPGCAEN